MARGIVAMAFFVALGFAARWIFGPDTVGAIAMLGAGFIISILALFWWRSRTGELVTPVEFHRRAAMTTLATPLWQHVAFLLIQVVAAVVTTLAVTVDRDFDGRDASFVAHMLIALLPVLIALGVATSLWNRRLALSLLARTEAEAA